MACRSANEPIEEGNKRGFYCRTCKAELQVSPTGQQQLIDHPNAWIFCNDCGFIVAAAMKKAERLDSVVINPAAQKQIDAIAKRGNN